MSALRRSVVAMLGTAGLITVACHHERTAGGPFVAGQSLGSATASKAGGRQARSIADYIARVRRLSESARPARQELQVAELTDPTSEPAWRVSPKARRPSTIGKWASRTGGSASSIRHTTIWNRRSTSMPATHPRGMLWRGSGATGVLRSTAWAMRCERCTSDRTSPPIAIRWERCSSRSAVSVRPARHSLRPWAESPTQPGRSAIYASACRRSTDC